MGKVSENGYGFEPGHGKGIFGQPYKADSPMHDPSFPAWAETWERRLTVIVTYLERRAHRHKRPQPGNLQERFVQVAALLEKQHRRALDENAEALMDSNWAKKASEQQVTLTCIESWPEKVVAMVDLHWPKDERAVASWDAGQCAFKLGISQRSALVRHLFINLEKIGQELFPDSERKVEDADF